MRFPTPALLMTAALLMMTGVPAQAQESVDAFPTRAFRLIVPYSPGTGTDLAARRAMQGVAERLGKPVVTENRVGASGLVGMAELVRSAPDGYSLAHVNIAISIAQAIMPEMNFSLARDVAGVGLYSSQYAVIVTPATQATRSIAELVALAKSRTGALNFGSGGNGTPAHMTCELFRRSVGIDAIHVNYKSIATALNDTARGELQFSCSVLGNVVPLLKQGRLRALAVSNPARSAALPDVPTLAELGVKGVDVRSWAGLIVPAKTPPAIIGKLNRALRDTVAESQVRSFFESLGLEPAEAENSPAQLDALMRSEGTRWAGVARELNLKVD